MLKAGKWTYTEEQLEQMFVESDRRGQEALKTEVQARHVHYDFGANRLVIELKNGATHSVPCHLIQGLRDADPVDIAAVELDARGASLHWEKLDNDFTVGGLVRGVFGNKKWMEALARQQATAEAAAPKSPRPRRHAAANPKRKAA
jgi:hypothetical protein